jgi:hypothetical protein
MKIAIVLYGQPRDYLTGYRNIMAFIKQQSNCTFDFFYHAWKLNENEIYSSAPWRPINKDDLIYKENTITELKKLYNPISYECEYQTQLIFNDLSYKNTLAFNNTVEPQLSNINNILFQLYSRNKARNLLNEYLKKEDNNEHYDFVLCVRFDIINMPEVNLSELNISNTYISNKFYPRKIIADMCIISPTSVFLEWFNIYEKLKDILDNDDLAWDINVLHEKLIINAEELIFAKYIFHYKNVNNIKYFKGGTMY